MTTRDRIIKMIREIEDENILRTLENWIKEMDIEKRRRKPTNSEKVNELDETYSTRVEKPKIHTTGEKLPSESRRAIHWLKKIADSGGIQSIKDPVKWQKDLRKDRSLTLD